MSVQKIIAEADKLLDKGKVPEAVEKLKAALQAEPMNQLATTKLANLYAESGNKEKAAATFISLANRLSDAGKSQVAIAVYKQALEFAPNDIALKLRYAQECESVGKVGDAQTQAQSILQYYLRRKKYFDATNILPMLVRLNGKDERLKQAWIEVMQFSQAEKKLVHLLVALCGPPGLVSEEFKVGGEPTSLSDSLYEGLKELVIFFPRDPKVAYAAAWCAYRRGKFRDFFRYLRECLRREPDFCLGILLFARVLAEREKLNEAYFVFKFLKERLASDKSVDDISTLNQLVEAFVQKNGWITFAEQTGDQLQTADFLNAIQGVPPSASGPGSAEGSVPDAASPSEPVPVEITVNAAPESAAEIAIASRDASEPPAEIELGAAPEALEIHHHSEGKPAARQERKPAPERATRTFKTTVEPIAAEPAGSALDLEPANEPATRPAPPAVDPSDLITSAMVSEAPNETLPPDAPEPAGGATIVEKLVATEEKTAAAPAAPMTFNPLLDAALPESPASAPAPPNSDNEATQIFSPMELIEVGKSPGAAFADVKTKIIEAEKVADATSSTLPSRTVEIPAPAGAWSELKLDGAATELYSPLDVLKAQDESRPHHPTPAAAEANDATMIVDRNEATMVVNAAAAEVPQPAAHDPAGVMPIPQEVTGGTGAESAPGVDLGDDLLDGATRILIAPAAAEATKNLIHEIQQEIGTKEDKQPDSALLLRKAERFIAKRNYYLARKALRHALALGADEETVKSRLRDVRKLEFPDSLYHAVSSDQAERVRPSEILERLEAEFEVAPEDGDEEAASASIEEKLEEIFQTSDPRTILDFGIGLHEMGLYRQAERVFVRIVGQFPEFAFDAYYLAAVSKFSRKDYAGAVSILKRLSLDANRTEAEKIQIYYALGELFEKMSQRDRSQEFFKKVAELDSNYRNIRHKLET